MSVTTNIQCIILYYFVILNSFELVSETIKQKEWAIVSALDFNICVPTYLDYLGRIIYNNFQADDAQNLESIRSTSIYVLKMCLYHYEMLQFSPKILAYSALCYSVKCLFSDLIESLKEKNLDIRSLEIRETNLVTVSTLIA